MTDRGEEMRHLRAELDRVTCLESELRLERARLMALAYGEGATQGEIAAAARLSQARVGQLIAWAELIETARLDLGPTFIASTDACLGLIGGDYTLDERLAILEQAAGRNGQPTEDDVWQVVRRSPGWRARYGRPGGLWANTRDRRERPHGKVRR